MPQNFQMNAASLPAVLQCLSPWGGPNSNFHLGIYLHWIDSNIIIDERSKVCKPLSKQLYILESITNQKKVLLLVSLLIQEQQLDLNVGDSSISWLGNLFSIMGRRFPPLIYSLAVIYHTMTLITKYSKNTSKPRIHFHITCLSWLTNSMHRTK